jgi:hypothetical protein
MIHKWKLGLLALLAVLVAGADSSCDKVVATIIDILTGRGGSLG